MNEEKANYGNWIPEKMLIAILIATLIMLALTIIFGLVGVTAATWIFGILCIITAAFCVYMCNCHELFAFGKGNMMAKVHQHLVERLDWDGEGKLLDIGCGAAALTVRCAKAFPNAQITGMDYWGKEWNYAKEQCEKNAKIEGVDNRCHFDKGDAAFLIYNDESFDAAVSNFVFHEVRSADDKRNVVREALRVVKKGGSFAFQDMFDQKGVYGDINEFIEQLKAEGVAEVNYIGKLEDKLNFPNYAKAPWMIKGVGIIYGKK